MNRRIIIIDDNQSNINPAAFAGFGNNSSIFGTSQLFGREGVLINTVVDKSGNQKEKKEKIFIPPTLSLEEIEAAIGNLGQGDGVLLVGSDAFTELRKRYHFGIRGENYYDCSKLRRVSLEGGAFAKCIVDTPELDELRDFLSEDFTTPRDFSWFKQYIVHTYESACDWIYKMDREPDDRNFGFDYEASGMPWDHWFELSGFALCTRDEGAFISLTDLRHNSDKERYEYFLYRVLAPFLLKRMSHIWVYNESYEFQVSFRMLGVDLYNLCDASVFNILSGHHMKKYSLKWSANLYLQSTVWDSEFDWISDTIDSMLFAEEGKLKKEKRKVLKVSIDTYKNTPEWAALIKRYPEYSEEFEALMQEYFGNPFMCIPSDILGYYCNLDAFYTLMIYESEKSKYTERAINVFLDNIRLQTRLHSSGILKWETYRNGYEDYCIKQMAWGIQYCAMARCEIKMRKHRPKMADINKYPLISQELLKRNEFFGGDSIEITKYLLSNNVDVMDAYPSGLNEGKILMEYGNQFCSDFLTIVDDSKKETKFKGKIDSGIAKKKKIISVIAGKLVPILGLDKIKINDKHIELEKYLYYERAYKELKKISDKQFKDIDNLPDKIRGFGQVFDLLSYSDYISDNYFKCKSPIENDEICEEFAKLYPKETAYLAAIFESVQQLNNTEKYYESLGIKTIEEAFDHFHNDWEKWCLNIGPDGVCKYTSQLYPFKIFHLSLEYWRNITNPKKYGGKILDQVKEVWDNFNGYSAQEQFFKYIDDQYEDYLKEFDPSDLDNNFFFMRKMVLNYLLYKKYSKVLTTYIGTVVDGEPKGMFLQTDKWVIEDPKTHLVIREASSPQEPGAICKMFARFQCMEKSSKRWSSGYHTIVSHSDIKSTILSYPGCLLSYFDISSAEVKSAGFQSQDPDLIDKFVNGIDIYIYTAKLYLGEDGWNNLPDKEKKSWRKRFKTIFLGILYGLGKKSLAEKLNCSVDEAETIIESVYNAFPKLREYVKKQQEYPFTHDGYINTFFGDKLQVDEWKYYKAATTSGERTKQKARIERLGVNLPIQGGTSTAMSSGFFNDLRAAKEEGWNLTSFITVHDSNTCNFPAEKLWEIRKFYDKNFTDFCYKMTGIKLLFDIEIGATYQDSCSASQISDDIVELKGNARSILMIINRLNEAGVNYQINMCVDDIKPDFVTNSMSRFIQEKGCSYIMDKSKYKVQFKKI